MQKLKKVKIGRIDTHNIGNTANAYLETSGRAYHTGAVSAESVKNVLMNAKRVREITPYKSASFESGSIIPRKLVSVTDSMTADEKDMYIQLCKLAGEVK